MHGSATARLASPRARVGLAHASPDVSTAANFQKRYPPLESGLKSLETWPSTREEVSSGTPGMAARPALLALIEDEIDAELLALGGSADSVSRLNVFRKAFGTYIRNMKTYAPLLTRIQTEFERALAETTRALDELVPARARLQQLELEHQKEILRIQREYEERIAVLERTMRRGKAARIKLQEEKQQLSGRIAQMEKEIKAAHTESKDQFETNKSLVSHVRHLTDLTLRAQQEAAALPELNEKLSKMELELRDARSALATAETINRTAMHSIRSASRPAAAFADIDASRASSRSGLRSESPDVYSTPLLGSTLHAALASGPAGGAPSPLRIGAAGTASLQSSFRRADSVPPSISMSGLANTITPRESSGNLLVPPPGG